MKKELGSYFEKYLGGSEAELLKQCVDEQRANLSMDRREKNN